MDSISMDHHPVQLAVRDNEPRDRDQLAIFEYE